MARGTGRGCWRNRRPPRRRRVYATHRILGVKPLKNAENPSFLISSRMTVMPPTLDSKFWFWIRVLMTSSGCEIAIDETCAPSNRFGEHAVPAGRQRETRQSLRNRRSRR